MVSILYRMFLVFMAHPSVCLCVCVCVPFCVSLQYVFFLHLCNNNNINRSYYSIAWSVLKYNISWLKRSITTITTCLTNMWELLQEKDSNTDFLCTFKNGKCWLLRNYLSIDILIRMVQSIVFIICPALVKWKYATQNKHRTNHKKINLEY